MLWIQRRHVSSVLDALKYTLWKYHESLPITYLLIRLVSHHLYVRLADGKKHV